MNHYELVTEAQKLSWKKSISPEKFIHDPKPTPQEERDSKISAMKEMKTLKYQIEKLKDSEDIQEVREFWKSMLLHAIYKSLDAFWTIDLEF